MQERSSFASELFPAYTEVNNTLRNITCTRNFSSESSPNKAVTHSAGLFQQLKDKCLYERECLCVV
jgi:hypothetical protein